MCKPKDRYRGQPKRLPQYFSNYKHMEEGERRAIGVVVFRSVKATMGVLDTWFKGLGIYAFGSYGCHRSAPFHLSDIPVLRHLRHVWQRCSLVPD